VSYLTLVSLTWASVALWACSQEFFPTNMLSSLWTHQLRSMGPGIATRPHRKMAERPVLVGLIPQVVVIDEGDQVSWISDAGNLRVEFDVNRCPFSSNVFQAPAGMRLLSGPPRPGSKAATYKYRLWLNDQLVGHGEVILREK
jgi:hypothetical protein